MVAPLAWTYGVISARDVEIFISNENENDFMKTTAWIERRDAMEGSFEGQACPCSLFIEPQGKSAWDIWVFLIEENFT